jgi:outer membrane biosynthesis protein TonB
MVVGGAFAAIAAHVAIPIGAILVTSLLAASVAGKQPDSYIEEHIVEARFVQRGKKPDPKKLPDRIVPILSTAPDPATVVSKNMNPEEPEKPPEQPENPKQDLLTRLGDRAQAFAEIAEEREKEGDPLGSDDGTETEAQAGDLYAGQLHDFFKRGWTIPNTIGDPTKLVAIAEVEIQRDQRIGRFAVVKSSGVPLFDQSVEDRLQQLRTEGATVPDPPPEVAHKFLGRTITVRFKGD